MDNGPWSFDDQLLVLRKWEKGMTARSVSFSVISIWVQVWGLPFDLINEEAGMDIRKGLGHVVEVDIVRHWHQSRQDACGSILKFL